MYLVGFPLLLIPLVLYNIVAFLFGMGFSDTLFSIPMMSGAQLGVTTSDLLLILSIFLLFIEILKATRFGVKSIVDHILSFVVFVVALGEFLLVPQAATSTFLLLLVICIVDVVGGFSISIRAAARDFSIEGGHPPVVR
jgi:hypothetical protein